MDCSIKTKICVGIGVGVVSASIMYFIYSRKKEKNSEQLVKRWIPVARVSRLDIYPVKSFARVEVQEANCEKLGLSNGLFLRDRCFMAVNHENNFLHARIHPKMVLIQPSIKDGKMELSAPGMDSISFNIPLTQDDGALRIVRVWGQEVPALDCGNQVAQWLSRFILGEESGARLVHYPKSETSRPIKRKSVYPWMRATDGAAFSDLSPYHLLSTASVADLNSHLSSDNQISSLYFRPTIEVTDCQAFAEDDWIFMRIGQAATFRHMKKCDRCVLTTIDPSTGIKHPDAQPLRTLREYRLAQDKEVRSVVGESPFFGADFALEKPGKIKVGDIVYVGEL